MPDENSKFADALAGHDREALLAAFAHCNEVIPGSAYDRTTLGRWLNGSIPSRGEFVACLGEQLDDEALHRAWMRGRDARGPSDVKNLVTRFQGLSLEHKEEAFTQIRAEFVKDGFAVRHNFSMRIDVNDLDDDLLQLRVAMDWDGPLPENTTVVFITEHDELDAAYESPSCMFRDVVALSNEQFETVFRDDEAPQQHMSYSDLDRPTAPPKSLTASPARPGVYEFGNERIPNARNRLRMTYPYPRGFQLFPIIFGKYLISGTATVTLVLHSQSTHSPIGYGFAGDGPRWQASQLPRELVIHAGGPDSVLGTGTGVVLSWSERT